MDLKEILVTVLINAVVTGGLFFGLQKVIERRLQRSLEKFKMDLQLAAFEHQIRFTKLYERRAEVIAELHKRFLRIQSGLYTMLYQLEEGRPISSSEADGTVYETTKTLGDYFKENLIYIPEGLCNKIETLNKQHLLALINFWQAQLSEEMEESDSKIDRNQYIHDMKEIVSKVSAIRNDIECEFRKMIGDTV